MSNQVIEIYNGRIDYNENVVLKNINLKINQGEFVYLIGKTGSGKSSLLKVLYGENVMSDGQGVVAEFDIANLKKKHIPLLRRKIGIVFQDFQLLYDRNINENLSFVLKATGWKKKNEIDTQINHVLAQVGLSNKGYKMPHQLSGGEQQRVSIARALLNNPKLILADEPTGNLDPETTDEIMDLLVEISQQGVAILMATHDYRIIDLYPSKIIKCDNGEAITLNRGNSTSRYEDEEDDM